MSLPKSTARLSRECRLPRRARHGARPRPTSSRTAPSPPDCAVTWYLLFGRGLQSVQIQGYTHVRLVFAPEFDAAFFGGDPDNFTYPRYDLDISFFRVYKNDKPAHPENYLRWSKQGARENEQICDSGHPGSTGRQRTRAQLES